MGTELQDKISGVIEKTHRDYDSQKARIKQRQKDQVKQDAQYQNDLAEYEQQKAEYDKAVQQLEAEQKAEDDKALAIKQAEQNRVNQQKAINDKYDSQITALGNRPAKYYYKPKYSTNRYTGKKRFIGNTRESNNNAIKNYNSKVDAINRERKIANSNFNLANSNLPQWAKTKAARAWNPTSFKNTSAVTLAKRYYDSFLADSAHKRASSITNAKSNAVLAREKLSKIVKSYEIKKLQIPNTIIKSNGVVLSTRVTKPLRKATKRKTRTHVSTKPYVRTLKKPSNILGDTQQSSEIAVLTFKDIQYKQKELFEKITGSKTAYDADHLRTNTMEKNPALGTYNEFYLKNVKTKTSGFVVEKVLKSTIPKSKKANSVKPLESKTSEHSTGLAIPELSFTSINDILTKSVGTTQNIPKPFSKSDSYVFGGTDGFFKYKEINPHNSNQKEAVRIAGGIYGDHLKTISQDTLDYQLKMVGLGAKRGFTSYTSLAGVNLIDPKTHGKSLVDLGLTDVYNSVYNPIIKPAKSTLESWGIKVSPGPANPKPFELSVKAFNKRTPAENLGDIVTVGTVEAGLFVLSGGVGNLAIRGASKLPYLLKHTPKIPKQIIDTTKIQSPTKIVNVSGVGKVKLTNFDHVEPRIKPRRKLIRPNSDIQLKKIKVGGVKINVIDFDAVLKVSKNNKIKSPRKATSTKFGKWLAKHTPQYRDILFNVTEKATKPTPKHTPNPKSLHSEFINSRFGRKIGQSRILNPQKKDKGNRFAEDGKQYNLSNNYKLPELPTPDQILKTKTQQQSVLKSPATKKTPGKNTEKSKTDTKKKNQNDAVEDYDVYQFSGNMTNTTSSGGSAAKNLDTDVMPRTDFGIKSKLDFKLVQPDKFSLKNPLKTDSVSKTSDKIKDKSKKSLRYGLTFKGETGVKSITNIGLMLLNPASTKYVLNQPVKEITKFKPFTIPITRKRIRNDRVVKLPKVKKYGKNSLKFSVWNVGVHTKGNVKGAELRTSKSFKLFENFDKIEERQAKKEKLKSKKSTVKKKTSSTIKKKKPVTSKKKKIPTKRKSIKRKSGKRR